MTFPFLERDDAECLMGLLEKKNVPRGSIIVSEGDMVSLCWFLEQGRLLVKRKTRYPGRFVPVAVLDAGAMVGEQMLAHTGCHRSTVLALEDAILLEMPLQAWQTYQRAKSGAALRLLQYALRVSSLRLQGATERLANFL